MHSVSPEGQLQVPSVHVAPAGQALPHEPQLAALVCRSTQVIMPPPNPPVHAVSPVAQPPVQAPFTHELPGPQRLPQAPQLLGAELRSTQMLLHVPRPPPHAQVPEMQLAPVPQTLAHVPQFEGSTDTSVHAPLQSVWPEAHETVHAPLEQT